MYLKLHRIMTVIYRECKSSKNCKFKFIHKINVYNFYKKCLSSFATWFLTHRHLSSKSVPCKLSLTTELFHWAVHDERCSISNRPYVLQAIFLTSYEFITIHYRPKRSFLLHSCTPSFTTSQNTLMCLSHLGKNLKILVW
jgi:hypothetical protein